MKINPIKVPFSNTLYKTKTTQYNISIFPCTLFMQYTEFFLYKNSFYKNCKALNLIPNLFMAMATIVVMYYLISANRKTSSHVMGLFLITTEPIWNYFRSSFSFTNKFLTCCKSLFFAPCNPIFNKNSCFEWLYSWQLSFF